MVEFEIIDIVSKDSAFIVEIELTDTRQRRRFGYPLGEGWEDEIDGEPKFVMDIKDKLKKEELVKTSKKKEFEKKIPKFKFKKFRV